MDNDPLGEAFRRLRLPHLATLLGLNLPEREGHCRSPLRPDNNPSFKWKWDERRQKDTWIDFGTKDRGDGVDFLAKAKGISNKEALPLFLDLAGVGRGRTSPPPSPPRRTREQPPPVETPKVELPAGTHPGTEDDLLDLLKLRGWGQQPLSLPGLRKASESEVLRFGSYQGERCWFLCDPLGRFYEARKMNGQPFAGGGKSRSRGRKSLLMSPGVGPGSACLLLEGAPDFLAACILREWADEEGWWQLGSALPIAALGANGGRLRPEDLEKLKGARIVILPHLDSAGLQASQEWRSSLLRAGAKVETVDLRPFQPKETGKDLSDCIQPCFAYELASRIEGKLQEMKEGGRK